MKLTLTIDEVREIIAGKFGILPKNWELAITYPNRVMKEKKGEITSFYELTDVMQNEDLFVNNDYKIGIRADMKIPAIKAVRQYYYDNKNELGLYEAKTLIENWRQFVDYCIANPFPWKVRKYEGGKFVWEK